MKGNTVELAAKADEAWKAYDAVARTLPDCEHVRAWRAECTALRKTHLRALRAYDRAVKKDQPQAGTDIR